MCQARRSFSPWQCDEPWFAGYWQVDPKLEWNMWWCLFHNCSGVSGWYTPIFFYPDMTYTTSGRQMREHWRELKSGIWQQVRALKLEKPKVAVHYSQASVHMTFLRGRPKAVQDAWEGWLRSLEDIGVPYDFVSYAQIEDGILHAGQYRVLILPSSIALSTAEAEAAKRFVESGGLLIADVFPGVTDDHGKRLDTPRLAALFGADPSGDARAVKPGLILTDGTEVPRITAASGLTVRGARSAGRSNGTDVPVLLSSDAGKGRAVLLNFELASYVTERRLGQAPERVWRRTLTDLLREHGIVPSVLIAFENGDPSHAEAVRYLGHEGEPVLFGVLNGMLPGMEERRAQLTFDGVPKGSVYDVRAQRVIGIAPTITAVLKPGEPKLYAVLPAVPGTEAMPASAGRPGRTVEVPFSFTGLDFPQAVQYQVTDATGRLRDEYSGVTVSTDGRGTVDVPLAVNDPEGVWHVRFRHVITGLTVDVAQPVGR